MSLVLLVGGASSSSLRSGSGRSTPGARSRRSAIPSPPSAARSAASASSPRTRATVANAADRRLQLGRASAPPTRGPLPERTDALADIDAEVPQLTGLVDDLFLLARSDSGALTLTPMPTDLGDVVTEAASSLTKAAGDRGVRLSVDPAPAVVRADAARVRQVVTILVDNALRHTPRGGEVRSSCGQMAPRPRSTSRMRARVSGWRIASGSSIASGARPGRARGRHGPRPGHRTLDRRAPRRPDHGLERAVGRGALPGRAAAGRGRLGRLTEAFPQVIARGHL